MLLPYNIDYTDNLNGIFTTDFGLTYSIEFFDYSMMFPKEFKNRNLFSFNFFCINKNQYESLPKDERVKLTIFACLATFFEDLENVAITICESLDNKEVGRYKLFNKWFLELKDTTIEKYDCIATTEDIEIYNSLLIHKDNPYKKEIIKLYFDLNDNEMMPL